MSKYTTEVRYICENQANLTESKGYNDIDTILTTAAPRIFNFSFPIFDEQYRLPLEKKILKHYYVREIGFETVGLWKHFLDMRLNEIMPYYNKLYESALLTFNPLQDTNYTREHTGEGTSTGRGTSSLTGGETIESETTETGTITDSGTTSNSNTRVSKYSDTPQGGLTGLMADQYLTSAESIADTQAGTNGNTRTLNTTHGVDESRSKSETGNTTNNVSTTDEYLETIIGKTGSTSFSKLLKEYRETFLNIDLMIINDLADLFFGLW